MSESSETLDKFLNKGKKYFNSFKKAFTPEPKKPTGPKAEHEPTKSYNEYVEELFDLKPQLAAKGPTNSNNECVSPINEACAEGFKVSVNGCCVALDAHSDL